MASRKNNPTLARVVRPEDLRRGQYVSVLYVIDEHLPLGCLLDSTTEAAKPVALRWLPCDRPEPLEVLDVCLPFILVQPPVGNAWMLDVRQSELARLDADFARRGVARIARKGKKKA